MKISELVQLSDEQFEATVYGVELDTPVLKLPNKLERLCCKAVICERDPSNLDGMFLSKIANLLLSRRVEIVVEIPHTHNLDIKRLSQIATTMRFNLSFLCDNDADKDTYYETIKVATTFALSTKTFSRVYYPINSYLSYKASDALGLTQNGIPDDYYISKVFFDTMNQEIIDGFKLVIDEVIEDVYGDVEVFNRHVATCALSAARLVKEELQEIHQEMLIYRALHRKPHRSKKVSSRVKHLRATKRSRKVLKRRKK